MTTLIFQEVKNMMQEYKRWIKEDLEDYFFLIYMPYNFNNIENSIMSKVTFFHKKTSFIYDLNEVTKYNAMKSVVCILRNLH